jgi:hypothetical protein
MSHPAPGPSTPILPTSTSALSIPDPFLVDEPDDLAVEGEDPPSPGSQSPQSLAHPSDEISLDVDPTPTQSFLSSAQVEKDVPPIPSSSDPDDRDEEDSPDIIVPGIIAPTMFLPIPHVRFLIFFVAAVPPLVRDTMMCAFCNVDGSADISVDEIYISARSAASTRCDWRLAKKRLSFPCGESEIGIHWCAVGVTQ